jgi:hypothetical protein
VGVGYRIKKTSVLLGTAKLLFVRANAKAREKAPRQGGQARGSFFARPSNGGKKARGMRDVPNGHSCRAYHNM